MTERLFAVGNTDRLVDGAGRRSCPAYAVRDDGWDDAFGVSLEYDTAAQSMPSYDPASGTITEAGARRAWIAALHAFDRKMDGTKRENADLEAGIGVARELGWLE